MKPATASPTFTPWRGPRYGTTEVRLLAVGESHYGFETGKLNDMTENVAKAWRDRSQPTRLLDALARLVREADPADPVTGLELDAAAFANFVQTPMPSTRITPNEAHLLASAGSFPAVVEEVSPTHVLAIGRKCWSWMPEFDEAAPLLPASVAALDPGVWVTTRGRVLVANVPHLSRGFSMGRWRPAVLDFLASTA